MSRHFRQNIIITVLTVLLTGCASMVYNSVIPPAITGLQYQSDLDLVCDGAPAFLLIIDSMTANNPDNAELLIQATKAYTAYSTALAACERKERAEEMSFRARDYGQNLLTRCGVNAQNAGPEFSQSLAQCREIDHLFWGGYSLASWINFQQGSPAAMAALVQVEEIMKQVIELDDGYYYGGAHLLLGAIYGSRPPTFGGRPKASHNHFERALKLSKRQFLPVQVSYAETYARTTFNRKLYQSLLQEVIYFPLTDRPELTLANQIAKKRARQLLADIELYF